MKGLRGKKIERRYDTCDYDEHKQEAETERQRERERERERERWILPSLSLVSIVSYFMIFTGK